MTMPVIMMHLVVRVLLPLFGLSIRVCYFVSMAIILVAMYSVLVYGFDDMSIIIGLQAQINVKVSVVKVHGARDTLSTIVQGK